MKVFKVELGQEDYPDDMCIASVMVLAYDVQEAISEIDKTMPKGMNVASIVPIHDYNYVICSADAIVALDAADLSTCYFNGVPADD